jgi:protein O-mannosyl-transferase
MHAADEPVLVNCHLASTRLMSLTFRAWSATVMAALIVIAAFAVYWPAIHGQFIWDDAEFVTASPLVHAGDGLYRMWFTSEPIDYWPLTNSMYWLEWRLWGMNPAGYHIVNILLHAANALLFWALLRRLSIPAAPLAALVFVVHPLNAESVAWIAEGKNTLSLFFLLLSTIAFIASEALGNRPVEANSRAPGPSPRRRSSSRPARPEPPVGGHTRWLYPASIVCFAAAMLSKGSVAMLPGILLTLVWWRRGRIKWRDAGRVLPFALIAIGLTMVNVWFQTRHVSIALRDVTMVQRVLGAAAVVWFYLLKSLLPLTLIFVYPQWHITVNDFRWWLPLIAAIGITSLLWWKRDTASIRSVLFAWAVFCLALVPVMGLTDAYYMRYALVADRYAYIALLPIIAAVCAGLDRLATAHRRAIVNPSQPGRRWTVGITGAVLSLMLGIGTWHRSHVYADADTLWTATLRQNPLCWLCETNLAVPMVARGTPEDLNRAIAHLNAAIRLNPAAAESYDGLGVALQKAGRFQEAIVEHERALALNPYSREAHANLVIAREHFGLALAQAGRFDDAATVLRLAVQDAPDHASTHRNLADALLQLGRIDESYTHLQLAIRLDPSSADNHDTLARLYRAAHRQKDAIAEYRESVRLAPNDPDSHNNLGAALLEDGQLSEAAHELRAAIRLNPRLPVPHRNLGVTLAEMNQLEEAGAQLREALRLEPSFADARANLEEVESRLRHK